MLQQFFNRRTIRQDITAGLVLGVESVPDGLAQGVLAAVNPIYGLYAYMVGTFSGAFFTSSVFMAVQATGGHVADRGRPFPRSTPKKTPRRLCLRWLS